MRGVVCSGPDDFCTVEELHRSRVAKKCPTTGTGEEQCLKPGHGIRFNRMYRKELPFGYAFSHY
jgi:hypothetical protein